MHRGWNRCLSVCVLSFAALILANASVSGGDKKGEDKKNNEALQQVQRDTFVARRQD